MHPLLSCKYFLVSDHQPNLSQREQATKRGKDWSRNSMFCKILKQQFDVMSSAFFFKKTNYFSSESLEVKHLFLQVRKALLCRALWKA